MRPAKTKIKKFRMDPKYVHHRSEGLTRRQNAGTKALVLDGRGRRTKRSGPNGDATDRDDGALGGDVDPMVHDDSDTSGAEENPPEPHPA